VLEAVAADRYGIGITNAVDARLVPAGARMVPLALGADRASTGSLEDVRDGRYPLSPFLHVYVDVPPGQPMDPVAREYLALLLSPEGQRIMEASVDTAAGLVPLGSEEARRERARIETYVAPSGAANARQDRRSP
jgi:phosphate transport system substrate-binding protein